VAFGNGEDAERRVMNAKKLMVGSVTVVTVTLFTGAMYAQQLAVPREDTAQTPIAPQEEEARADVQATLAGIDAGGADRQRHSRHRSAEPPDPNRAFRPTRLRDQYAIAPAVERREGSFGRWSHEAHKTGG
jgi:hypothetical protein